MQVVLNQFESFLSGDKISDLKFTQLGRSTLHAPITSEGIVLSQPHKRTTPSMGLARIDSSTSMLTRLR